MIASRPDRVVAWVAALAALSLAACHTPGGQPAGSAFVPPHELPPLMPDEVDHTAADLATATLASNRRSAAHALAKLRAADGSRDEEGLPPTGLMPSAQDLVNATLDDERSYRSATENLLDEDDLDAAVRGRLEQVTADDPLRLADQRTLDARITRFGQAFNAVAEPLGTSILNATMAPYRLSQALLRYAIEVVGQDPIMLQERQALVHWQRFLDRNPQAPEAEVLIPRVQAAQARLSRTWRNHAVSDARDALDQGQVRRALVLADRALRYAPEDEEAEKLRTRAADLLEKQREQRSRSLGRTGGVDPAPPGARPVALALLRPDGDVGGAADALLERDPDGPLADEAHYVRAIAFHESGDETAVYEELDDLAGQSDEESNMARHARALLFDPNASPYAAFRRARGEDRALRARWIFFGPFFAGPPERGIPPALNWAVELPSMAQSVVSAPMRLIQLPWTKPFPTADSAAYHARRYLDQHPRGEHADEARDWLEDLAESRENFVAMLSLAEDDPDADPEDLEELREKAADQVLHTATNEERRDMRMTLYQRLARDFPGTEAGEKAGHLLRADALESTPQHIAISRGFLEENPEVAGSQGLGLHPSLMDDDPSNGELHPDGVALLGGRVVEISYLAESGDEDDPPEKRREKLSEEHLARVVSRLEETSFENSLVDAEDPVVPDAQRDLFFERARLGLVDEVDRRAAAESDFTYTGMRERYGVVRSRESILPFDIVIKGSFPSLALGAFPRIREPRKTPDAFLYK